MWIFIAENLFLPEKPVFHIEKYRYISYTSQACKVPKNSAGEPCFQEQKATVQCQSEKLNVVMVGQFISTYDYTGEEYNFRTCV